MQIRKLVKSGYSSLVVALPKEWIESNSLKAGDQVYLEEENNVLFIKRQYKEKPVEKTEKIVNIDGKNKRIIGREIVSAYLDNYYYLILKGKEIRLKAQEIKEMISGLIALEVIDESSEKIVAKSFLNIYDTDLKVLVRRMDNIIRSMMADLKEALKSPEIVDNIVDRDREVNKLNFLISKILKTANNDRNVLHRIGMTDKELLQHWELNIALEKIGDRVKHMARIIPDVKDDKKKLIALLESIEAFYKDSMQAFYTKSIALSDEICTRKEDLGKEIGEFSSSRSVVFSKIAINAFNINGHINDIGRLVRYTS